jgi:hypothetical protein
VWGETGIEQHDNELSYQIDHHRIAAAMKPERGTEPLHGECPVFGWLFGGSARHDCQNGAMPAVSIGRIATRILFGAWTLLRGRRYRRPKGVDQKETHMSGRLTAILVSLAMLTSAAFALTITRSTFLTSDRLYSTSADFDQAFAQFVTAVDPESIAANREKIRKAGLERLNLE